VGAALCRAGAGELEQIGDGVVLSAEKHGCFWGITSCTPAAPEASAAVAGKAGAALPGKQPGLGHPSSVWSLQHLSWRRD